MQASLLKRADGFTLIEIVGVMVIIGLLSSIGAAKVLDTDTAAKQAAIQTAVIDLNGLERLSWSQIKLSDSNWTTDDQVFASLNTDLGAEYHWISLGAAGGTLKFKQSGTRFKVEKLSSKSGLSS